MMNLATENDNYMFTTKMNKKIYSLMIVVAVTSSVQADLTKEIKGREWFTTI